MITIIGGEISKLKGSSITYKPKCDKCGHTNQSEYTVSVSVGITEITTKKCLNCGNNQLIKMKHCMN